MNEKGPIVHSRLRDHPPETIERSLEAILDSLPVCFFACDSQWRIIYTSCGSKRLPGFNTGECVGSVLWEIVDADLIVQLREDYNLCAAGENRSLEVYDARQHRWFCHRCTPLSTGGISVCIEDVSETKPHFFETLPSCFPDHATAVIELPASPSGFGFTDGRMGAVSAAFAELIGYTRDEIQEMKWAAITPAEWLEHEHQQLAELHRTGNPVKYEKEYRRKDGSRVPVELLVHLIHHPQEKQLCYYALVTDITERKKAERELQQSEKRFRLLAKAGSEVLFRMNSDWTELKEFISEKFYLHSQQVSNDLVQAYVYPDDQTRVRAAIQHAIRNAGTFQLEHRVVQADGSVVWISAKAVPLFNSDGAVIEWVGAASDITERKKFEAVLQQWADAVEYSAHGIAMIDPASEKILICNPAFARILGQEQQNIVGASLYSLHERGDLDRVRRAIENSDIEKTVQYEASLIDSAGRSIPVQIDMVSVFSDTGKLVYRVCAIQDISARRRFENALRESKEIERGKNAELQALIAAIPSPVWISYDSECKTISGNDAGLELLGVNRKNENQAMYLHEDALPRYRVFREGKSLEPEQMPMNLAIATGEQIQGDELKIVRADGTVRWIYANAVPLFDAHGAVRGCVCAAMEITALKETEKALRISEQKYRQIFETASDALLLYDAETFAILDINSSTLQLYGYTKNELIGSSILVLSSEPEQTRRNISSRVRGPVFRMHCKKDGTRFPAEINATYFALDGRSVNLAAVRDIGKRKEIEDKLKERREHLAEVNAALKALLRQREQDRQEFEDAVESNIKYQIIPYFENLQKSPLNDIQHNWVRIIESHLDKITSTFTKSLTLAELNLSNAELKVAALVRDGKTTKEIAEVLRIAPKTVSAHRGNIRRKLGFKGKQGGLRYLLLSLA